MPAAYGVAGSNRNFQPEFTVPASMELVGYAVGGPAADTPWYRSVDVRGVRAVVNGWPRPTALYPASKAAAVKAALDAAKVKYKVTYPYSAVPRIDPTSKLPAAETLRIFLTHPQFPSPPGPSKRWLAADVTTLLASLHTAITT